jgi:hypothetical protein
MQWVNFFGKGWAEGEGEKMLFSPTLSVKKLMNSKSIRKENKHCYTEIK